jgi:hypothetical protein
MKHPVRWLLLSIALLLLTPFAVFPEIMGDVGPRNVSLWRNVLGIVLLAVAALGIIFSAAQIVIKLVRKSRG